MAAYVAVDRMQADLFRQRRTQKGKHDPKCCNSSHGSAGGLGVGVPLLQQRDLCQGQGYQRRPSQQRSTWRVAQNQLQDVEQEQAAPYQSCNSHDKVQRGWKRQSRLELVLGLKQGWSSDGSNDCYDGSKMSLQSTEPTLSTCSVSASQLIEHTTDRWSHSSSAMMGSHCVCKVQCIILQLPKESIRFIPPLDIITLFT